MRAAWVRKAGQAFPFVLLLAPSWFSLLNLGPRAVSEKTRGEDASSQWIIWIGFILPIRNEETATNWEATENEQRRPSMSLAITFV